MQVTDEMLAEQATRLDESLYELNLSLHERMAERTSLLSVLRLLVADVRSLGPVPPQLFVALAKADEALAMCSAGAQGGNDESHG